MTEDEIVDEIRQLDAWSLASALPLLDPRAQRTPELSAWARSGIERLSFLADRLAEAAPAVHADWRLTISEALLDFDFIDGPSGFTSLRLGRARGRL
jgi:hypothetical protein